MSCNRGLLDKLLTPSHVAVVGASDNSGNAGFRTLSNLERVAFSGQISVVNPSSDRVKGLKCHGSIGAVVPTPDVCVVALRSDLVENVVEEGVAAGCKAFVIFAGSDQADVLGDSLRDIALRGGAALCGPNSMGNMSPHYRVTTSFGSAWQAEPLEAGPISIVSQSGSVLSVTYALAVADAGFSHAISVGNGSVLHTADYLEYLAEDEATEVVAIYCERFIRPAQFLDACQKILDSGRKVALLKGGRTQEGRKAAVLHTGALATDDEVMLSFLRDAGVLIVGSVRELAQASVALTKGHGPNGRRIGVIASSGGGAVVSADLAAAQGLVPTGLGRESQEAIKQILGASEVGNPVDISAAGFFDGPKLRGVVEALNRDPDVDQIAVSCLSPYSVSATFIENALDALADVEKPAALLCEEHVSRAIRARSRRSIVVEGLAEGFRLLAILAGVAPPEPQPGGSPAASAAEEVEQPQSGSGDLATEPEVYETFPELPVGHYRLVSAVEEARAARAELGGRVALKLVHAAVPHRARLGMVALDLRSDVEIDEGYSAIERAAGAHGLEGPHKLLVQEMSGPGPEVVVGIRQYEDLGHVIIVSRGGSSVDRQGRPVFGRLPIASGDLPDYVAKCISHDVAPPDCADVLSNAIWTIASAWQTRSHELAEVEFNPVVLLSDGPVIVDALGRLEASLARRGR